MSKDEEGKRVESLCVYLFIYLAKIISYLLGIGIIVIGVLV